MFIYFKWNMVRNVRHIGRHLESYLKLNIQIYQHFAHMWLQQLFVQQRQEFKQL